MNANNLYKDRIRTWELQARIARTKNNANEVTSEQAKQLLTDQLSVWESARDNYKALEAVQVKELTVEGCTVKIQFNPARIVSSAAKVDTQSLKERKCFLCAENRPEVQEGLPDGSYTWLLILSPYSRNTLPFR